MGERLDSKASTPLYRQLMEQLRGDIVNGVYKPGEKLLPEVEMAKQFNVSVITARKATDELVAQGLVEKKQGKGTFVAQAKYSRDYTRIQSFSDSCVARNLVPGAKLLSREVVTPKPKILQQLGLPPESKVLKIVRLRFVNGDPMVIETNFFSLDYAFLLQEDLDYSLFAVLKNKRQITVENSQKIVEICRATPEEAHWLKLRKNAPLLLVRSVAYTKDYEPVYVCMQVINGERFQLSL